MNSPTPFTPMTREAYLLSILQGKVATLKEREELIDNNDSEVVIPVLCDMLMCTQGDLARASGLTTATISRLKNARARKLTKVQKAALKWAVVQRLRFY